MRASVWVQDYTFIPAGGAWAIWAGCGGCEQCAWGRGVGGKLCGPAAGGNELCGVGGREQGLQQGCAVPLHPNFRGSCSHALMHGIEQLVHPGRFAAGACVARARNQLKSEVSLAVYRTPICLRAIGSEEQDP